MIVRNLRAYVLQKNKNKVKIITIVYPHICTMTSLQHLMINELKDMIEFDFDIIYKKDVALYGSLNQGKIIQIYYAANNKIFEILLPKEKMIYCCKNI